jgi:hypothetical protein
MVLSYSIIRYGKAAKGDMILPDTAYFTGYTSYIGNKRFMNVEGAVVIFNTRRNKEPQVQTQQVFYLASFGLSNDTLTMKTITENFSSSRQGFNSPAALKAMVTTLIDQGKNIYDDLYALSYRKTPRPKPLKPF